MKDTSMYEGLKISEGVEFLKNGYVEYAEEVITGRALPSLYDGLKPVNRRILATLVNDKNKGYMKSARISGNVLALHPHGEGAVYMALVLMTQKNGSLAFPTVDGSGNFGAVFKTDPPAAMRYTEAKIHSNADEFFGEMNGIRMIPNFDSTLMEPELLPVSFPSVLVNSTSGIAVGFKSNIPSFNFNDVCDLVIEYIRDGQCSTVIAPDFVTGGFYIKNEKELQKLMRTGSGKIKLRGRTIINGKEINVVEVPFGKTIQGLIKQINTKNIQSIRNAYDTDDFDHDTCFTVDCKAKNRVDEALYAMYKETDFQYTYSADITVVKNGAPVRLGVWNIIAEWVSWRKSVLEKEYSIRIEDCKTKMREANAFMTVVNNYEKRMQLVNIIASEGRAKGREFIRDNFTREEVPEDLIKFVSSRSLPDYHDGGKYANAYEVGLAELNSVQYALDNLGETIISQMEGLKKKYGSKLQRRTEITSVDYEFSESSNDIQVDDSPCVFSFKDGFLRKLRYDSGDKDVQYEFRGNSNDTLIAFDNRGRILRVYCSDLALSGIGDLGTYLPNYFGLRESDDYRITWIGRLEGKELMILYKDGTVGFVDTSEWIGNNRNVKILEKGISVAVADKLGAVLTEIPEMLFVSDVNGRVGWVYTEEIKHKDRKARTRVFNLVKNAPLDSYAGLDGVKGSMFLNNLGSYRNKLKDLVVEDFKGDLEDFKMMI